LPVVSNDRAAYAVRFLIERTRLRPGTESAPVGFAWASYICVLVLRLHLCPLSFFVCALQFCLRPRMVLLTQCCCILVTRLRLCSEVVSEPMPATVARRIVQCCLGKPLRICRPVGSIKFSDYNPSVLWSRSYPHYHWIQKSDKQIFNK